MKDHNFNDEMAKAAKAAPHSFASSADFMEHPP